MSSSTKAVIVVIILGLIAAVATLPADNPLKMKVNGVMENVTGKSLNRETGAKNNAPKVPVATTVGKTQPQQVELPAVLPFDETLSSGNKQVDALIKKANKGDVQSQYDLGRIYRDGRNVAVDYVVAYMWFNIARANGDAKAKGDIKSLTASMDNRQIAQGQKLASLWWDTYKR